MDSTAWDLKPITAEGSLTDPLTNRMLTAARVVTRLDGSALAAIQVLEAV